MPTFRFRCLEAACGARGRRLLEAGGLGSVRCPSCGGPVAREDPGAPHATPVEVLDNGVMARSVERRADIEELLEERERAHEGGGDR